MIEKRIEILQEIYNYVQKNGYPPSVRELCNAVNLKSTSTVHSHIQKLETKGYLYKEETHPRSISITQQGMELIKEQIKEPIKFSKKDYKVLLAAEIFLRENGFSLIKEYEDMISEITCILNG